jgi:predicted ATPase
MSAAVRENKEPAESILALFAGRDVGVFCRSYLAHLTWHCGDDDQAISLAAEAIEAAERIRDPFSQAIALNYATMLHVFRSQNRSAFELGVSAVELCKRYGFTYYLAMANVLTGWARGANGAVSAGLEQLRDGLDSMRHLGAEIRLPFYFKLLAETLSRAGLIGEALAHIATGFAFASKNREMWPIAELHLTHGELLAAQGKTEMSRASFQQGLEAARLSGSVGLERKVSLAATERLQAPA